MGSISGFTQNGLNKALSSAYKVEKYQPVDLNLDRNKRVIPGYEPAKQEKQKEEKLEDDMTKELMAKLDLMHNTINHIDKRLAIVEVNMISKDLLDKNNKEQAESITKAIVDKITISEKNILLEVSEKVDKKLPTWLMVASPIAILLIFISSIGLSNNSINANINNLKDNITVVSTDIKKEVNILSTDTKVNSSEIQSIKDSLKEAQ